MEMTTEFSDSELARAHDTNRRLNRRLGDAERTMSSLVGQAQRDCNEAQRRTTEAQRMVKELQDSRDSWMRAYARECAKNSIMPWLTWLFFAWAVAATLVTAFWPR
jgi:uncharacterized protein HemX